MAYLAGGVAIGMPTINIIISNNVITKVLKALIYITHFVFRLTDDIPEMQFRIIMYSLIVLVILILDIRRHTLTKKNLEEIADNIEE